MTGPVVVLTFDPVGPAMAGPAIRAWNLARALAGDGHEVVLASTTGVTGAPAEAAPPGLTVRDA
ncbi:MAG TPA: hypothetical protein VFP61_14265, partial [Acidimicrobiales bacterium]|nr:hypothetical protein [Acidimicrobiales bacterium]